MKIRFLLAFIIALSASLTAQNIQSPSDFLGYSLGERFTRHHKVVEYFQYVSKSSSNVVLEKYGETNEYRPLYVSYVSSSENIKKLDEIRLSNLGQTGLASSKGKNDVAIVWLSYNVHGNEASSTEAAMQTLYELVTKKQDWLKNTVVIIDPCLNPDGRDRYVNWYNQVKSTPYNSNQDAKEHKEPWPGGRPNHYLFDLNRDWAWATQVESSQRLSVYNKWMPHIHVDFHEQYINNPYYFAPAAEPFHEIITNWQRDFQTQIGKNHAKYFDRNGWLYFTKESFDLLYPSYGDTYPTYMGAIGMTYEQAGHGMAGLGIDTDHGYELTLKDRVAHHTTTGLSTVEMGSKNAQKLNQEFATFFNNKNLIYKSYVLKNENADKTNRLLRLLDKHQISYEYTRAGQVKGYSYQTKQEEKIRVTDNDLVIHTDQPKGKMVKVLFEPNAKLTEPLTYDITAWSIPYAHGFTAFASKTKVSSTQKFHITSLPSNIADKSNYAYLAKWNSIDDASFLADLLKNNIRVRFSEKPFSIKGKSYQAGTLIVLRIDNKNNSAFDERLVKIANKNKRNLHSVQTGFVDSGKDFGSYSVKPINPQKVAVLSGEGASSLSFGEVWHFFETQLKYPLTILDTDYLSSVNLENYDVLIIPEGYYGNVLNKSGLEKVSKFTRNGGTVIAIGSAVRSFADKEGFSIKTKKSKDTKDAEANLTPYADQERESAKNLIAGAIFKSKVDNTHPLAFGYEKEYFTLKRSSSAYDYLPNGNVAYFGKSTSSISGFAGKNVLEKIPETLLFGEERRGSGSIVYMVDNPLFRSFWENGKLFFVNAIFFRNSDEIKR